MFGHRFNVYAVKCVATETQLSSRQNCSSNILILNCFRGQTHARIYRDVTKLHVYNKCDAYCNNSLKESIANQLIVHLKIKVKSWGLKKSRENI